MVDQVALAVLKSTLFTFEIASTQLACGAHLVLFSLEGLYLTTPHSHYALSSICHNMRHLTEGQIVPLTKLEGTIKPSKTCEL